MLKIEIPEPATGKKGKKDKKKREEDDEALSVAADLNVPKTGEEGENQ